MRNLHQQDVVSCLGIPLVEEMGYNAKVGHHVQSIWSFTCSVTDWMYTRYTTSLITTAELS